jgi:hypothetical protein
LVIPSILYQVAATVLSSFFPFVVAFGVAVCPSRSRHGAPT